MPALDLNFLKSLTPSYNQYSTFIETGTLHGQTMENLSPFFEKLHTIEVYEPNHSISVKNLENISNVELHLGNSVKILPSICHDINNPAIFFLDGHWSSGHTGFEDVHVPLYDELGMIVQHMKCNCLIIIDDARLFGTVDGGIVDWSKINESQIIDTVKTRVKTFYYLPSRLHEKDRLILELYEL
jgi:hypothetical protein